MAENLISKTFKNGESLGIPLSGDSVLYMECCDCGLIHTVLFKVHKSAVEMIVFRNDFETDKRHTEMRNERKRRRQK